MKWWLIEFRYPGGQGSHSYLFALLPHNVTLLLGEVATLLAVPES